MTPPPSSDDDILELEELVVHPGTYFNPQTEVVVIVDDSVSIDQEVFDTEAYEGADWVRISDEVPVDEHSLDEAMEKFLTSYHPVAASATSATALEDDDTELDADEDDEEAGRDPLPSREGPGVDDEDEGVESGGEDEPSPIED